MTKKSKTHILRGFLCFTGNGDEEHILSIINEEDACAYFVAERARSIFGWGGVDQVSVRYYTSKESLSKKDLQIEWMKEIMGSGDARYSVRYSDPTGYLWTDEKFNVGGHNLIQELQSYVYNFIHLEIEVHKD